MISFLQWIENLFQKESIENLKEQLIFYQY